MNAAEEIVKYWYQQQGYFLKESIRLPRNKEIDFLAVRLSPDGKRIEEKLHIEVQVSNRSANYTVNPAKLARDYHQTKFESVKSFVKELLGKGYKMVEVRGKMAYKNKDIRDTYIKLRRKKKVKVIPFENILKEVQNQLGTNTQSNSVIQTIQLIKFQK